MTSYFDACRGVSSVSAAEHAGLKLRKSGKTFWAHCPFHEDKTASMALYDNPDKGWYCFSCKRGGDAVKLYQALYSIPPAQAAEKLAGDMGLAATISLPVPVPNWKRDKFRDGERTEKIRALEAIVRKADAEMRELERDKTADTLDYDLIDAQVRKKSLAQEFLRRIEEYDYRDSPTWKDIYQVRDL